MAPERRRLDQLEEAFDESGLTPESTAEHLPEAIALRAEPGDTVLFCSDGLNKHVDDQQIATGLGKPISADGATQELVALALAGGGTDNVTAIVARVT